MTTEKRIDYHIEFFSQWHCGSGLSAGADIDLLVIKDKEGMPFIPGKTLKGLIREAVENLIHYQGQSKDSVEQVFGKEGEASGCAHFSNAQLNDSEYKAIVANKAQHFLYQKVTTTSISDNDGIAEDHSLRSLEVVVPCTLHAHIDNVPDDMVETVTEALGLIKRLGHKRTRGLGRCDFRVEEKGGKR